MTEEEKEAIERAKRELQKTTFLTDIGHKDLETILNLIQKQQEKLEKKDKQIELMAEYIKNPYQLCIKGRMSKIKAIREYFEKQAEEV